MREIKFRAWFTLKNKMVEHENLEMSYDRDEGFTFAFDHSELNPDGMVSGSLNFELMQYTGLKDRNGKDIYEGDIVSEHHGGLAFQEDYFQTQVVKWESFGFMPFLRVIGGAAHDYANNLKEYIVIGNIYENPELLKEAAADA